jgi:hypothetical protein
MQTRICLQGTQLLQVFLCIPSNDLIAAVVVLSSQATPAYSSVPTNTRHYSVVSDAGQQLATSLT